MTKLKLGPIVEDKPVRVTIDIPSALFEDMRLYGKLLAGDGVAIEPARLVVPMLQRFVATIECLRRHAARTNVESFGHHCRS